MTIHTDIGSAYGTETLHDVITWCAWNDTPGIYS